MIHEYFSYAIEAVEVLVCTIVSNIVIVAKSVSKVETSSATATTILRVGVADAHALARYQKDTIVLLRLVSMYGVAAYVYIFFVALLL